MRKPNFILSYAQNNLPTLQSFAHKQVYLRNIQLRWNPN